MTCCHSVVKRETRTETKYLNKSIKRWVWVQKRESWPLHRDTHCTMKPEGLGGGGCLGRQEGGENGGKLSVFSAGPVMGWGELWGDGRKWGRAEAGWVTWAFVGRWWEAPPWPLARNAKQHCHCLMSGAADACAACFSGNQEQKQSPPPPSPPPTPEHCTHTRLANMFLWTPQHLRTPHTPYDRSSGQTERRILPHSWPQRSTESKRSDKWWHSGRLFSSRYGKSKAAQRCLW